MRAVLPLLRALHIRSGGPSTLRSAIKPVQLCRAPPRSYAPLCTRPVGRYTELVHRLRPLLMTIHPDSCVGTEEQKVIPAVRATCHPTAAPQAQNGASLAELNALLDASQRSQSRGSFSATELQFYRDQELLRVTVAVPPPDAPTDEWNQFGAPCSGCTRLSQSCRLPVSAAVAGERRDGHCRGIS